MKISIVTPVHDMQNRDFFFNRLYRSIASQTFKNFEWIVTENGKGMASNTNEAIRHATGDIVKILFLDDYFATETALQTIAENFKGGWLATACEHDNGKEIFYVHYPIYSQDMVNGNNSIGSPSVIAFENTKDMFFDESMSWMLDCDLYMRLYARYGYPTFLNDVLVVIGVGEHQMTYLLSDEQKHNEQILMLQKYAK